jgi:hypothetical protein
MKILLVLLAILLMSAGIAAQPASHPPGDGSDLTVVKFSWSKERIGWEQDPFSGPIENWDEVRVRSRNEKRISDAKKGGSGSDVSRAERDAKTDAALVSSIHQSARPRYGFVYKVIVQNNSQKPIKAIDWDYVFVDQNAQIEVGRREFSSVEKISPGKSKELKFFIPTPPTRTVSVSSLNENERKGLVEDVAIVQIEYADGTFWRRP